VESLFMKVKKMSVLLAAVCVAVGLMAEAKNYPVLNQFPDEPFYLQNVHSGMVLTIKDGNLVVNNNWKRSEQKWHVPSVLRDGRVFVKLAGTKSAIAVKNGLGNLKKGDQATAQVKDPELVSFLMMNDTTFFIKVSDNMVLDEQGGEKKKTVFTKVIWYPFTGKKNQQWRILLEKDNSVYNYRQYAAQKKSDAVEKARLDVPFSITEAMQMEMKLEQYMKFATGSKFSSENGNNFLSGYINDQEESKRYTLVHNIVKYAAENKDNSFREGVYADLTRVKLESKNFVVNALKGKLKANIQKAYNRETHGPAKGYLKQVMDKFN